MLGFLTCFQFNLGFTFWWRGGVIWLRYEKPTFFTNWFYLKLFYNTKENLSSYLYLTLLARKIYKNFCKTWSNHKISLSNVLEFFTYLEFNVSLFFLKAYSCVSSSLSLSKYKFLNLGKVWPYTYPQLGGGRWEFSHYYYYRPHNQSQIQMATSHAMRSLWSKDKLSVFTN